MKVRDCSGVRAGLTSWRAAVTRAFRIGLHMHNVVTIKQNNKTMGVIPSHVMIAMII